VYPTAFSSESGKWVVGFDNSKDAEIYKTSLMSGKTQTPYDAPQYYSQTGKYYQGKAFYTYKGSFVPQYSQKSTGNKAR
jgi:hypothetical protein